LVYVRNTRQFIPIEEIDVIWWRRIKASQVIANGTIDHKYTEFINSSFYTALTGSLYTKFSGKWISHPMSTALASNKLFQLQAAKKSGFRVPRTIVSQDPDAICSFQSANNSGTIIKALQPSTGGPPLFTQMLTKDHLSSDKSIMLCPVIYQELIQGTSHLRVNCFGRDIYAVMLETSDLDWRVDLRNTKITVVNLQDAIKERIYRVCKELQLKMGIFDFKVTSEGEIVWLEVNPQGQFLFIEGITGFDLKSSFAKFLYNQAMHYV